jgi:DNA polymerase-3 subunit delta
MAWHDGRMPDHLLAPLRLVAGDEELLVSRAVAGVTAAARADDPAAEVREVDTSSVHPGELDELLGPSLFGGRRVVIVRSGQDAGKELAAALLAHAADPAEGTVLVVTHAGGAKGKAFAEGLRGAGAVEVQCAKITKAKDRLAFVRAEVKSLGGRCTDAAAELLLDAVGTELREIASACSQLVADTGGVVDETAVRRYHRGRADANGFTVADAAMVGDVGAALEALRWALSVGVDPVPIADALADGVRTVARVSGARRANSYQLAGELGMPPWKVERAQRHGRGWSPEGLAAAMGVAARLNGDVKGGAEDRAFALERAVLAIAAARARRPVGAAP